MLASVGLELSRHICEANKAVTDRFLVYQVLLIEALRRVNLMFDTSLYVLFVFIKSLYTR